MFIRPVPQKLKQSGVSLIEVIIVVTTIGFLVLLMNNIPSSIASVGKSRHQSIAREVAAKQIEDKRATAYPNIAVGTQNVADPRLNLLPGSSGTVLVEDCPSTICAQGENAKQITVTIKWKEGSQNPSVSLKTIVGEGGLNQ